MLAYCAYNGIGVIPWSPLAGGLLARPAQAAPTARIESVKGTPWELTLTEADIAIVNKVEEFAKAKGCTMAQIAVSWACKKITSPIVGISSVKRLEEAMVQVELTDDEIKSLEAPSVTSLFSAFTKLMKLPDINQSKSEGTSEHCDGNPTRDTSKHFFSLWRLLK